MSRILHIVPFAFWGGTEKDCYYFVKTDKRHQHEIVVLDKEGPICEQWRSVGAKVTQLNCLHNSNNKFIQSIELQVKNKEYAAILYWSTIKLTLVRYSLRNQTCKLAVHVGNPVSLSALSTIKHLGSHYFHHSSIETCLFACSEYVRKTLLLNPYYKLFPSKVSLNPVELYDENPYIPKEITPGSEVILGMTARLDPIKDHETVLKAFSIVVKEYPNACLWLLGDGVLRTTLEQLAQQLGIGNNVLFHGNVDTVYSFLQQMDVFVYSTTPREGLGNAVSEAMANGLPSVVPDLPMMLELAGNDSCLILCPPKSPGKMAIEIISLLKSIEKRKEISAKAFQRAKGFLSAERYVSERSDYLFSKK